MHPTSVVHALVRFATERRSRTSGIRTCACRSRSRSRIPERRATSVPGLDFSAGLTLEFEPARSRALSAPRASRARRASAAARIPCAFNAANEVAVAAFLDGRIRLPRDRDARRGRARRVRRRAGARPHRARRGRRAGHGASRREDWRQRESLHRDPRSRVSHPRPRGRALLRVARRRASPAAVLHRVPAGDREDDARAASSTGSARSRSVAS